VGAPDRLGSGLGQADVADVAGLHHLGDSADRLLDRYGRIDPAEAVDVDVIGAQPAKRVGEGALQGRRATVDAEDLAIGRPQQPELDAERARNDNHQEGRSGLIP
jgi:hypothetical protein